MTYGRPLLTTDILPDQEMSQTVQYIINLGQIQKTILDYANKALPAFAKNTAEGAVSS